jgi:glycogen debranching enzyme
MNRATREQLTDAARALLLHNRKTGVAATEGRKFDYCYTCPSPGKYPHQWLWDSCFHVIVLSRLDPEAASRELASLFHGMRPNGFLPNMLLWEGTHSPMERLLTSLFASGGTSNITQPPVTAFALEALFKNTGEMEFLRRYLPLVKRHFGWLEAHRDPDGDGLVSVIHPWETGVDASPSFDSVVGWYGARPHPFSVYRGLYGLLLKYRRLGWGEARILASNAFDVESVIFNCIYAQGLRAIARLSQALGDADGTASYKVRADRVEQAILEQCWDKEAGLFFDLAGPNNRPLKVHTISSLFPLILDSIPKEMAERLVHEHLLDEAAFWTPFPVPSVSRREPAFNPANSRLLWRGPTWLNTNWFLARGLQKHGYVDAARELARRSVRLVEQAGFWEFYNPLTSEPGGQPDFAWSTLAVDLLDYLDS